jgi:hypothetical protein
MTTADGWVCVDGNEAAAARVAQKHRKATDGDR